MAKENMRVNDVFIAGGFPRITYIPREEHQLEARVAAAKDNLAKLLVVTGPTKSGKTVLVNRIFPLEDTVWIDGGSIGDETSFWESVLDKCSLYTGVEETVSSSSGADVSGEAALEGKIVVVKGGAKLSAGAHTTSLESTTYSRQLNPKIVAINALTQRQIPLIVDDFHYIPKEIQKAIVRALKAPIMRGLPVVFIAIPNRKYDAVEVEREMTGRVDNIEMPIWSSQELAAIATKGFKALKIEVKPELVNKLTNAAYGSPFLMQEFCRELCSRSEITEKGKDTQFISERIVETDIFKSIAEHSGRSMFEKLKRGPRARTDRKQRKLKNGTFTDIYGVVMEALKELQPGTETVSYDMLRSAIRNIIDEDLPQKNEVSRVLDKVAEISYSDASSTPVIDWQKDDDIITITDPFFAFFLKWS